MPVWVLTALLPVQFPADVAGKEAEEGVTSRSHPTIYGGDPDGPALASAASLRGVNQQREVLSVSAISLFLPLTLPFK